MDAGSFARALVVCFAVIDLIGGFVVFQTVACRFNGRGRLIRALLSTGSALTILALFTLAGPAILAYLAISLQSIRVSAGLLLGITAVRLVGRGEPPHPSVSGRASAAALALVPLDTPQLPGPGAITTTISFTQALRPASIIAAAICMLALTAVASTGSGAGGSAKRAMACCPFLRVR